MFQPGQRVRIKANAFLDSTAFADIHARGRTGTLVACLAEDVATGHELWAWRSDQGVEAFPLEFELEELSEQQQLKEVVCIGH